VICIAHTTPSTCPAPQVLRDVLEEAAGAAGLRLKQLDKKQLRAAVAAHKAGLVDQLAACMEPPQALALAVPLIVAGEGHHWCYPACPHQFQGRWQTALLSPAAAPGLHGDALSVPGKALGGVVDALLKPTLPEEQTALLIKYHAQAGASAPMRCSCTGWAMLQLASLWPKE
jgi:hypothetical protein